MALGLSNQQHAAGLAYAQQGLQNAVNNIDPAPMAALDMLENALGEFYGHLEVIRSRSQCIADRMFGPTPQAVPDQKAPATTQGMPVLRRLDALAESLTLQARRLSDEITRLERL